MINMQQSAAEDSIEDIILSESEGIVRKTHEMVTAWKSGTRRKRFRCQNVKGTF